MTTRRLIRPTLPQAGEPRPESAPENRPENRIVREQMPVEDRGDFREEGRRDFRRDRHQGGHHRRFQGGGHQQRHHGGGGHQQRHHGGGGHQQRHGGHNNHRQPLDLTFAESFYYLKQMKNRTPMVVRLLDGEDIHGQIEWYDRDAIKIVRHNAPNLLIPKRNIKYIFKDEDAADTADFDDEAADAAEGGNGRAKAASRGGDRDEDKDGGDNED